MNENLCIATEIVLQGQLHQESKSANNLHYSHTLLQEKHGENYGGQWATLLIDLRLAGIQILVGRRRDHDRRPVDSGVAVMGIERVDGDVVRARSGGRENGLLRTSISD